MSGFQVEAEPAAGTQIPLFPWGVVLKDIGWFGFNAMVLFLGLLVVGFIYEWRKGALEWE